MLEPAAFPPDRQATAPEKTAGSPAGAAAGRLFRRAATPRRAAPPPRPPGVHHAQRAHRRLWGSQSSRGRRSRCCRPASVPSADGTPAVDTSRHEAAGRLERARRQQQGRALSPVYQLPGPQKQPWGLPAGNRETTGCAGDGQGCLPFPVQQPPASRSLRQRSAGRRPHDRGESGRRSPPRAD